MTLSLRMLLLSVSVFVLMNRLLRCVALQLHVSAQLSLSTLYSGDDGALSSGSSVNAAQFDLPLSLLGFLPSSPSAAGSAAAGGRSSSATPLPFSALHSASLMDSDTPASGHMRFLELLELLQAVSEHVPADPPLPDTVGAIAVRTVYSQRVQYVVYLNL